MYKIAIFGKANSGKNTLAKKLLFNLKKEVKGLKAKNMALADPIKEMAETMFPNIDKKFWYGSSQFRNEIIPGHFDTDGNPLTYRKVLIDLGGLGRKYNPTKWIDVFDSRFNENSKKYNFITVSDARMKNEFDYFKQNGFFTIKLIREEIVKLTDRTETEQDGIPLELFDSVINNNKSLNHLNKLIKVNVLPLLKQ